MTSKWWFRLAIVAAVTVPLFIIEFCGLIRVTYGFGGRLNCPPCDMIFGPMGAPGNPFEMQLTPPWYMWPFYAILRSVPTKFMGMAVTFSSFLAPFTLVPFDWGEVPQRAWLSLWVVIPIIIGLGWTGSQLPFDLSVRIAGPVLTCLYFLLFLVAFPLLARRRSAAAAFF